MQPNQPLLDDHRALEAMATELNRILDGEQPDAAAVAAIRWRFGALLVEHCRREEQNVYYPLLSSWDVEGSAVAFAFQRELGSLGDDYSQHVLDWPVERINADWRTFGIQCRAVLARLADRIEREESLLYPLTERLNRRHAA
jgi:hypothetical protein